MAGTRAVHYGKPVHIWKGRSIHYALDFSRTLCGKRWDAEIVGPPADQKPHCKKCDHEMGLS